MWKISFSGNAGKARCFYIANLIEFSKETVERKYKNKPSCQRITNSLRRDCSSGGSVVKKPPANVGDTNSTSGLGKFLGVGNSNPLQYACLGSPMDRGAWWATA